MERSTYFGIAIFMALVSVGILLNVGDSQLSGRGVQDEDVRIIEIDAKWFEFNPNEIKINQGEQVTIKINNLDVDHGINIPELGVSGNEELTLNANKKGEFLFYCNNFCGVDHSDMIGRLIVE